MKMNTVKILTGAAALAFAAAATAQVSNDVVKIGVLTDLSGTYSDLAGPGSVLAVKMAVEDFGGKVLGKPIEVVVGAHRPTLAKVGPFSVEDRSRGPLRITLAVALAVVAALAGWIAVRERTRAR